jgi:hypothetical protein
MSDILGLKIYMNLSFYIIYSFFEREQQFRGKSVQW